MDYKLYQAEDFAADESFIAYFLRTDKTAVSFWEDWISQHPEKIDEVYNAEQLLALLNLRLPEEELHAEFLRFDHFLEQDQSTKTAHQPIYQQNEAYSSWGRWLKVAAFASFLIAVSALSYYTYQSMNRQNENTYLTQSSPQGTIKIIILPDGSKVTLNSNSVLKYPKSFGNFRTVYLKGEAFFEVLKNKAKPFIVHAGSTQTTVLGTKFNVAAYPAARHIDVALMEGSVSFKSSNPGQKAIVLKPGQLVSMNKTSQNLDLSKVESSEIDDWKDGTLTFRNSSFGEVAQKMNSLYGIILLDSSSRSNWNYSGKFSRTDYISVLQSICFARNLTFKQNKQFIILKPKK